MGSIGFVETVRHATPELALQEYIDSVAYDIEYRSAHHPDENAAEHLSLGKCVKEFKTFTERNYKLAKKLADAAYGGTNVCEYVNAGKDGYLRIEAKISKNKKRGSTYYVAKKSGGWGMSFNRIRSFDSKKAAEDYAKKYAIDNLNPDIYIINQKEEKLGRVYFDIKHYARKPKLTKKDSRALVPAYQYVLSGSVHIG